MALPSTNANDYGNSAEIEAQWAIKCYEHSEIYFNLLCALSDVSTLRLTRYDDVIHQRYLEDFADLEISKISEDDLKTKLSKEKWRSFCDDFRDVEDYNFGTLLRLDCQGEYSSENTTLVPKIQFLAIEIARNRGGLNAGLGAKFRPKPDDAKKST